MLTIRGNDRHLPLDSTLPPPIHPTAKSQPHVIEAPRVLLTNYAWAITVPPGTFLGIFYILQSR